MNEKLAKAIQAYTIAQKGMTHLEVKDALGYRYAKDAQYDIALGRMHAEQQERVLTPDEIKLLLAVATAERQALERGDTCSPKLRYLPLWPWSQSKIERLARKRLDLARKGEETLPQWQWTGLGLLDAYHGGYVRLRPAGWALVHALETNASDAQPRCAA